MGTILSVNKDIVGRTITYSGYFLLLIGFILVFTTKNSRFRQLNTQLKKVKAYRGTITCLLFLVFRHSIGTAYAPDKYDECGAKTQSIQNMQHNLANCPCNGVEELFRSIRFFEILRKLHKETTR